MEEKPLYGVILSGSVYMESYTTTFNVLYSSDDYIFSYILDHNSEIPKVIIDQTCEDQLKINEYLLDADHKKILHWQCN